MFINKFITDLKLELAKDLPSKKAHQRMMPLVRLLSPLDYTINASTKQSGVLILLYPKENDLYTVFIQRQDYDGVHSGQIAFPGGKFEKEDITLIQTALREANEEVGIDISSVEVLGHLSELFISHSNFLVLPVVAYMPVAPSFILNNKEVKKIIEVNINEILASESISENEFIGAGNKKIKAPCYNFNNNKVWGATAMIVSELHYILENI
ncbi:MAG: CoA pyrophosphatase [Bacteroidota bacterium]